MVDLDTAARTVTLRETDGFSRNVPVKYLSTDASDPGAAALEDVTFAPALNAAPFARRSDGTDSARAARQTAFADVEGPGAEGTRHRPGRRPPFAAAGFIVDCPIISQAG